MTKERIDRVLFEISDSTLDALKTCQSPADYFCYLKSLICRAELLNTMAEEWKNETPEATT